MTSRRKFLSTAALTASAVAAPSAFNILRGMNKQNPVIGHGEYRYRVHADWGNQDPSRIPVQDCHEMVMDARGRLILLTNHEKNNVIIYDRSGKVTDTWTLDLPGAHGLTLAQEGDEEVLFITDERINKVLKTTLDGKVLLELSYPEMVPAYTEAAQWKPTEVAVAPNGDFYVADGYGLNYIVQYSPNGEYIRHFGGKGEGDERFDCCHGVTLDQRDGTDQLLITSRTKNEFKRFSMDGEHLETISLPGCWVCRPVIKGDMVYFAVIVTKTWDSYDGMIAVLDKSNQVVSFPGGSAPTYEGGVVLPPESDVSTFRNPHDVCVDNDLNLYVPQWNSGKTYPIMLERV